MRDRAQCRRLPVSRSLSAVAQSLTQRPISAATDEFRPDPLLHPQTTTMEPIVLFGIQFTFCLVAYALGAWWYVAPRLSRLPREPALAPLLWIHVFRIVGGTILAPGSVDAAVPADFRTMIGIGDMATAVLAVVALVALR